MYLVDFFKIKKQERTSAIEDCSKAIELNPKYLRAILRRAQLYEQDDKLDEALVDFKKILEIDPSHWEARDATRVSLTFSNLFSTIHFIK